MRKDGWAVEKVVPQDGNRERRMDEAAGPNGLRGHARVAGEVGRHRKSHK